MFDGGADQFNQFTGHIIGKMLVRQALAQAGEIHQPG